MSDVHDAKPMPLERRLNQNCFCVTLDRGKLGRSLDEEAGETGFSERLAAERPHLFSNLPVFLPQASMDQMSSIVEAIEATSRVTGYREAVMSWAPDISKLDHGPAGALMGYDFHLDSSGPRLIEINTNAGGAFLNAYLAKAQAACCTDVKIQHRLIDGFEDAIMAMFEEEWRLQRGTGSPRLIAIVDDQPVGQYLFPEFVLVRQLLARRGFEAIIADPAELRLEDGKLLLGDRQIDLVYNRLVDFTL